MNIARYVAAILAVMLSVTAAGAASISFTAFSAADWLDATSGGLTETFETPTPGTRFAAGGSATSGELGARGYVSSVGRFGTLGGTGTGRQCRTYFAFGPGCEQIALQDDWQSVNGISVAAAHGQGNIVPDGDGDAGRYALSSADTLGIAWSAARSDGRMFDRIVFALRDPGDTGRRRLDILVDAVSVFEGGPLRRLADGATWLVVLDLDRAVTDAEVSILTSRNDGFTLDGAALVTTPIPVPASIALLLAGLAALLVARRQAR
jgi:hypothetical protein